ncbi:hypothetical protein QYE76_035196 [Lolium multiflorum]|uniref:Glucose-methanol-choline oxidoreductase N-terminal domain-containing protein n=1 Tax=Lolium multiflorum TaxID=4521 RepID=A0AAD8VNZ2_LOLMU|nr:hypothetical protein QYE76_035196 [Lolium multiflorum]
MQPCSGSLADKNLAVKLAASGSHRARHKHCGSCFLGCPTGDNRGTDTTWLFDDVQHAAVILVGCKAERFILKSSDDKNRQSNKCVGLVRRA